LIIKKKKNQFLDYQVLNIMVSTLKRASLHRCMQVLVNY